jgi:hypothetical protein
MLGENTLPAVKCIKREVEESVGVMRYAQRLRDESAVYRGQEELPRGPLVEGEERIDGKPRKTNTSMLSLTCIRKIL